MSISKRAEIFTDIFLLKENIKSRSPITMVSGGWDPLHYAHVDYIQEAAKLDLNNILVAVLNGDGWLLRKKGYNFMPEDERAKIIASISGVDYVLIWDDGGPTVCGPIEILKPKIFAKGGDRNSAQNVPEFDICEKIDCQVVFNVGGGKMQSSSDLVKKVVKTLNSL